MSSRVFANVFDWQVAEREARHDYFWSAAPESIAKPKIELVSTARTPESTVRQILTLGAAVLAGVTIAAVLTSGSSDSKDSSRAAPLRGGDTPNFVTTTTQQLEHFRYDYQNS